MNSVSGKVAIVTGGASGIGFSVVKELLRNGLIGATIADIDTENGQRALTEIIKEFGENKAIFIPTDVKNKEQFENAFRKTIEKFQHIDILVNNAGCCNEKEYAESIELNCVGTVNGTLLAVEHYLPKYRSGEEGFVVNIASIAGLDSYGCIPIYTGTKHFVVGFSCAMGIEEHYKRTKVRVVVICPGVTVTKLLGYFKDRMLNSNYAALAEVEVLSMLHQTPEHVARGILKVLDTGKSGSVWVIEENQPITEVERPTRFQCLKK